MQLNILQIIKKKFDLILIKQTIHFFNLRDIKKILRFSHDSLEAGRGHFNLNFRYKK